VGVVAYKIYSNGNLVATLGNVTSSTRTNVPSTIYLYTVSACDAVGNCSAQSAVVSVTTPAQADTAAPTVPPGLTATPTSETDIRLAWSAATDNVAVTLYRLYREGSLLTSLGNVTT
jgi:chitodextrinase